MGAYDNDIYGEPVIIRYPDGGISRVRHPILTPEEYAKRHAELEEATAHYLRHIASLHEGEIPTYQETASPNGVVTQ